MEEHSNQGKSMNMLFFNVPLHGHVNPTLDLVAEFVKKGHRVTYFASEAFKEKIEAIGATYRSYENCHNFSTTREITNVLHTGKEMVEAAEKILDCFVEKLSKENFDVVLYDISAVWGKFFAQIFKVPGVCCFPGKNIASVTSGLMLEKGSMSLNIVFTSPYFQPFSDNMTNNYVFIGPTLQARKETVDFPFDQLDKDKKVVYVSMGTLYAQPLDFFKKCFTAFANSPYQVIMSVGKSTNIDDLKPIPPNFIVKNYVPQLKILERTDVYISHAGMNSISESMFYNVPMLLLPKTIEQQINARRMDELGAGIDMKSTDATPEQLRALTEKLLSTPTYKEQTKEISQSFKETGGVQPAVAAVEKLVFSKP